MLGRFFLPDLSASYLRALGLTSALGHGATQAPLRPTAPMPGKL